MNDRPVNRPRARRRADFASVAEAARRFGAPTGALAPWRDAARAFPVRWPRYYLELARAEDPADPIRRMGHPEPAELRADPGDLADPVGERGTRPAPYVVRKHRDRALLLVTARCHFYCRFCFRRAFPEGDHRDPDAAELERALEYLIGEPDLREVILSGGDPLVLPDERLRGLLERLRATGSIATVRIHTRAPVHYPARVTDALADLLGEHRCWIVVHYDHPRELTPTSLAALRRLQERGLPVLNQNVLLRGVNADVAVLVELYRGLYAAGIKPYYLHHPDRAPGNAAFRVTLARGLELYRTLRGTLTGPALPAYVIDLPDGSGKVPVERLVHVGGRRYRWEDGGGRAVELEDIPEPE